MRQESNNNLPLTTMAQAGWATPAPQVLPHAPGAHAAEELQLGRPPIQLKMNWADMIGDISFLAGERRIRIETAVMDGGLSADGPWLLITGRIGAELFALVLEKRFAYMLARQHDRDMRRFPSESSDIALLMEFCLQPLLEQIETHLSQRISLELVDLCNAVPPHPWLCLTADASDEQYQIGLAPGPRAMKRLGELAAQYANAEEKKIERRLIVKVGPVALPKEEALTSGAGDKFDTGIDPAGEVRGILERSDGKFWPILIDDNEVTIAGELRVPFSMSDDSPQVLVGFEIGDLELGPRERQSLATDVRLPVNRRPNNGVVIWLNRAAHGTGHLDMVDGSLAIAIDESGDA